MQAAMRGAWPKYVSGWEGRLPFMYLDSLKYVTFGVGRKIEDNNTISDYGLARPWRDAKNQLVLETAIRKEFNNINAHTELASKGGAAFRAVATLHVTEADIDEALMETTDLFWASLVKTIPTLEAWPADAQMALMDMAYHMGPGFLGTGWPKFTAAAKVGDFIGCRDNCQTSNKSPRDASHVKLFDNAAGVTFAALDVRTYWGPSLAPVVAAWKPTSTALTSIKAAAVGSAKPNVFNKEAWYCQRMLTLAGTYKTTVDGLFGSVSRSAYATWAKRAKQPNVYTQPVMAVLSKSTLRMPVT